MSIQGQPALVPQWRNVDNTGLALTNGLLYTYAAGTTALQASYTDYTMGVQNTNPVVLNARGEASVWLNPALTYKLVLTDLNGNVLWSQDQVPGGYLPTVTSQISAILSEITSVPLLASDVQTAAEIEAGVTPVNYAYPSLNIKRYGARGDGATNDWQAIKNALLVAKQMGGGRIVLPDGAVYFVNSIDVAALSIPQQQSNGSTVYQNTQVVFYIQHASNIDIDFQGSTVNFGLTGGGLGFCFDGCTDIRLIGPKFVGAQVQSTGVAATSNLVGGSSYTNGSYINVPLTGGAGGGAVANIVVSGGSVTTCQIVYPGGGYAVNDTLSCSNTSIGGTGSGFSIKVSSITGAGPVVATASVNAVTVLCLNQNSLNISCIDLDVQNCFSGFYAVADPTLAFISSHLSLLGNTRVANAEYGVALHNSGDATIIENLLAFSVNRTFFLYGVQDVDIVAVGNQIAYGFQSVVKAYIRPTNNIRIKYTLENMPGKTTVASAISIQVQCDPAVVTPPPTVQNIFIDYYERNVTANGIGIEFDYFAGSGGTVQQTTSSNLLFGSIILRGQCVNYPMTTVQLTAAAAYCRINTANLVQANLAPGNQALSSTNGFIYSTRFTYTPTVQLGGGAATGYTFATISGDYYAANGICSVYGRITLSAKGTATGSVTISMPLTMRPDATRNPIFKAIGFSGMSGLSGPISGYITTGATTVATPVVQGASSVTGLADTNLTSSSDILFEATYPI